MRFLSMCLLLLSHFAMAEECQQQASHLRAVYQLQQGQQSATELQLLRDGKWVAQRYPAQHITLSWYLSRPGMIQPTRHFEQYQRSIEYAAGEVVHGKKETDWDYRNQLVSQSLLSKLQLVSESGAGCELQQTFRGQIAAQPVTLVWHPKLNLLRSLQIGEQQPKRWTLQTVSFDPSQVVAHRQWLDSFQTTDYADIGDDHSDPFLTKMVRQGFIEHGHDGFYSADEAHSHE